MLRSFAMMTAAAVAILTAACSKPDPPKPSDGISSNPVAAATTAATTAAAAATAAAGTVAATSIPVPEDYEATAEKTITADTLDAQLEQLAKDIAATPK